MQRGRHKEKNSSKESKAYEEKRESEKEGGGAKMRGRKGRRTGPPFQKGDI